MPDRPGVIIFTHSLLSSSMTFIKSHAQALKEYRPIYVGCRRVDGLSLTAEPVFTVNAGNPLGYLKEYAFRQFGFAPDLVRNLKRLRPELVHAHFGTSTLAATRLADKLDIPVVVTFHGKDATMTFSEARKSWRGRELLRARHCLKYRVNRVIAVSGFTRKKVVERWAPEEKVTILRNGIDTNFFQAKPVMTQEPIVLFVGRFVEKKGCEYLMHAASLLRERGLSFRLVLVGDGPLKSRLIELDQKYQLQTCFTGFLPVEKVRHWLNKARVVAIPSVTARDGDCEGLPTVVLEAQAMEKPIVATNHAGISEGLLSGKTGQLVEERDVNAMATSLAIFLCKPEIAKEFGQEGRRFVRDNFDINRQVGKLELLYKSVCNNRKSFATKV